MIYLQFTPPIELDPSGEDACCSELSPDGGLGCTLTPGHDGVHVAQGSPNDIIAIWSAEQP